MKKMKYLRSINESDRKKQAIGLVIRTDVKYNDVNGAPSYEGYQTYHICICYDISDAIKHIAIDIGFPKREREELENFCYIEDLESKFKKTASGNLNWSIAVDYWTGFSPPCPD